MRVITDKKILRKLIDPGVRNLYNGAVSEVARLRSRSARVAQPEACIPERVALLITFSGPLEDLVAAGLESAGAVLTADGIYVGEGQIDPMRIGELTAISHVSTVRLQPKMSFTLNKSVVTTQTSALRAVSPDLAGQGVVVGVMDSGIDWRHGSFTGSSAQSVG